MSEDDGSQIVRPDSHRGDGTHRKCDSGVPEKKKNIISSYICRAGVNSRSNIHVLTRTYKCLKGRVLVFVFSLLNSQLLLSISQMSSPVIHLLCLFIRSTIFSPFTNIPANKKTMTQVGLTPPKTLVKIK